MQRYNDSVIQSRVDQRHLAMATKYFLSVGAHPRSRSELVRWIIEGYAAILLGNGKVESIETTEEARQILGAIFGDEGFNTGRRGLTNLHSNLNLDVLEQMPAVTSGKMDSGMRKLREKQDKEYLDERTKIVNDANERFESQRSQTKYDENGLCIQVDPGQGAVTDEDMHKWKAAEAEQRPAVTSKPTEKKKKEEDPSTPRLSTKEEMDKKEIEWERKERIKLEKLRNM